eukprot:SAG22_NODE_4995_length_1112_cov_1.574531_2_plen_250_part_01
MSLPACLPVGFQSSAVRQEWLPPKAPACPVPLPVDPVDWRHGVLTIVLLTINCPGYRRDFSALALLSCGGAPLNRATIERALRIFDCEYFLSYGMTECCGKISMSLLTEAVRRLPQKRQLDYVVSSGRPFLLPVRGKYFDFEVRVVKQQTQGDGGGGGAAAFVDVDKTGSDVGEVWIRGDTVFSEYWGNPEATEKSFGELDGCGRRQRTYSFPACLPFRDVLPFLDVSLCLSLPFHSMPCSPMMSLVAAS